MLWRENKPSMPRYTRETREFYNFSESSKGMKKTGALLYDECLNFTCKGDAIASEIGCEVAYNNPIEGYSNVTAMCVYKQATKGMGVLFTIPDEVNFAYGENGEEPLFLGEYSFTDPVIVALSSFTGADFALVGAQEGVYSYYNNNFVKVTPFTDAKSIVWCDERVFLLSYSKTNRVWYSTAQMMAMPNYNFGNGYLDFEPNDGLISDMVACSDKIYFLRENKISCLDPKGIDKDFTMSNVSCAFGKPFFRSAQGVGGKVIFACREGLYIFNGSSLKKAELKPDFSGAEIVCSGIYDRFYFLSYTTAGKERTLFYAPETGEYAFADFGITAPAQDGAGCLFFRNGSLCALNSESKLCDRVLKKVWKGAPTDFEFGAGRKLLRRMTVKGRGSLMLTLTSDEGMGRTFLLDLSENPEKSIAPVVKGRTFILEIQSESADCAVERIIVTADVWKGGRENGA